jgi:hypothetical protein
MLSRSSFADTCKLTNTNNGVEVEAEIIEYKPGKMLIVSLNRSVKLTLKHNGKIYVGAMAGIEFVSTGPAETITYQGRR